MSKEDIQESFHNICEYSIYSHQSELKNEYITIKERGDRVGLCGTAVIEENKIKKVRQMDGYFASRQ